MNDKQKDLLIEKLKEEIERLYFQLSSWDSQAYGYDEAQEAIKQIERNVLEANN